MSKPLIDLETGKPYDMYEGLPKQQKKEDLNEVLKHILEQLIVLQGDLISRTNDDLVREIKIKTQEKTVKHLLSLRDRV